MDIYIVHIYLLFYFFYSVAVVVVGVKILPDVFALPSFRFVSFRASSKVHISKVLFTKFSNFCGTELNFRNAGLHVACCLLSAACCLPR